MMDLLACEKLRLCSAIVLWIMNTRVTRRVAQANDKTMMNASFVLRVVP